MQARLSPAELQVMEEFWKNGRLSIRDVQDSFPEAERPPYTSIQTIVYRLEERGVLRRVRKIGNAHIFEAVASRHDAHGKALEDVLSIFGGRAQTIMAHLVRSGRLTRDDIREAEKLVDEREAESTGATAEPARKKKKEH
jgi:predicted transcriptional regulator